MTDPAAWGVEHGWWDVSGEWHEVSSDTLRAVLEAMDAESQPPVASGPDNPTWVIHQADRPEIAGEWELKLEDGSTELGQGRLSAELPLGYHQLTLSSPERSVALVVTPRSCYLPQGLRIWGWAVQLYGLRSTFSWGIGDLGDLATLARWTAKRGGGMCMVNPIHAPLDRQPRQPSPYAPSTRVWKDPIYLNVEAVPGAELADLGALAVEARALCREPLVDRDRVWKYKREALEAVFSAGAPPPAFDAWRASAGSALEHFAVFSAISERQSGPWRDWPSGLRSPEGAEVARFARAASKRVAFHAWLQWCIHEQLASSSSGIALVSDLAVGVDPDGADTWAWQDCFAADAHIGAPPDQFNTSGQDWGLTPFNPWKLRKAGFAPWVRAVRANLVCGGGLRVDHVMGLSRQWWLPKGAGAAEGAYVRYPLEEMLDVLALESVRAGAFVIGEDLGTVEAGLREDLTRRGLLLSKVAIFEQSPPSSWPWQALASVSTHDLTTLEGLWSGEDETAQEGMGWQPDHGAVEEQRQRLRGWAVDASAQGEGVPGSVASATASPGSNPGSSPESGLARGDLYADLYRQLAHSPCAAVVATLDDALRVRHRPNMPGSGDAWPNWRLALPRPLEEVLADPRVHSLAEASGEGRGSSLASHGGNDDTDRS